MTDLCLELREGEQTSYTIRDVKEPCQVSIHARCVEPGTIQIVCEGAEGRREMSEFPMSEAGEITSQVMISAGLWQTVTVRAGQGCLQIDELEFAG